MSDYHSGNTRTQRAELKSALKRGKNSLLRLPRSASHWKKNLTATTVQHVQPSASGGSMALESNPEAEDVESGMAQCHRQGALGGQEDSSESSYKLAENQQQTDKVHDLISVFNIDIVDIDVHSFSGLITKAASSCGLPSLQSTTENCFLPQFRSSPLYRQMFDRSVGGIMRDQEPNPRKKHVAVSLPHLAQGTGDLGMGIVTELTAVCNAVIDQKQGQQETVARAAAVEHAAGIYTAFSHLNTISRRSEGFTVKTKKKSRARQRAYSQLLMQICHPFGQLVMECCKKERLYPIVELFRPTTVMSTADLELTSWLMCEKTKRSSHHDLLVAQVTTKTPSSVKQSDVLYQHFCTLLTSMPASLFANNWGKFVQQEATEPQVKQATYRVDDNEDDGSDSDSDENDSSNSETDDDGSHVKINTLEEVTSIPEAASENFVFGLIMMKEKVHLTCLQMEKGHVDCVLYKARRGSVSFSSSDEVEVKARMAANKPKQDYKGHMYVTQNPLDVSNIQDLSLFLEILQNLSAYKIVVLK